MSISGTEQETFSDVANFLNIRHAKASTLSTLFELKQEFAIHHSQDDIKRDANDDLNDNEYDDLSDEEIDSVYQKEQFLSFIRQSITDTSKNKRYSISKLSKSIMSARSHSILSPLLEEEDHHYWNKISKPIPMNTFADPGYICNKNISNINWQFGFVKITAQWRPEFMDVITFKQFNIKKAAQIFKNGQQFMTSDAHKGWKNLYWFFDDRSLQTKRNQKHATKGMKLYLNEYKDGIILKFNHNVNIAEYNKKECFKLISDDEAINKSILCGVLRAYCNCDVVEWQSKINIKLNDKISCVSCNKAYFEPNEQNNNECYWIQGIAKKHDNFKVFLCGKCIIELVIQGTDKDRVNIFEYLTDSLTNNRKITELCLVHRLFATSSQLMQLLINSFCGHWSESETAGMLKVINFVIKWLDFLWFEDFKKESKARILLNRFISFLLMKTNGKKDYSSIYKATQKLIKTYRDQNLLQQQLDAELEANLRRVHSIIRMSSPQSMGFPNISSKVMLQNMDHNYLSDDDVSWFDTDKKCDLDDLSWFDSDDTLFKYILQKRHSLLQFKEYEYNAINSMNQTESIFLQSHCHEFAAQLTLVAFDLFRAIRPTELLCKAWTKKDKHVTAPNIAELIIFMEAMTVWAKFEIAVAVQEYRRKTVERVGRIGIELLKLGNQYGAVQIYLCLVSADLKWFKNDIDILFEIDDLKLFMNKIGKLLDISRNHASLRRRLWNVSSPAIPYLGVFLKDAFQADELLTISKLQKVNPKQMALLYGVYDKIELFRTASYSKTIKRNDIIIRYIHRQLHRSKKINVKALSSFCKQQSIKERNTKRSFWG